MACHTVPKALHGSQVICRLQPYMHYSNYDSVSFDRKDINFRAPTALALKISVCVLVTLACGTVFAFALVDFHLPLFSLVGNIVFPH